MPFPIAALIIAGISFLGQSLLAPKPKFSKPKESGLNDFDVTTADEKRPIAYIAGNVKVAPNITWYGDLINTAITKHVATSPLSGTRQTLGYRYNLGWEAGLCFGPQVKCKRITYDDKEIFNGALLGIPATTTILQENLFGGEGEEGEGGINWVLDFYSGDGAQPVNAYMQSRVTPYAAHNNVCYVVSRGPSSGVIRDGSGKYLSGTGYIGKALQMRELAFFLERLPATVNPSKAVIGSDVNPVEVLYELFTSKLFGGKIASSRLKTDSWLAASNTLYNEGFGISVNWNNPGGVEEMIQQIVDTIDGAIFMDYSTGLIDIKLVRNDYDANTLRVFDRSNSTFESFSRGSWEETINQLDYEFISRADDYKSMPDVQHELANFNIRGVVESGNKDYKFIYERALASKCALRDLRVLALPLAKGRLVTNRTGSLVYPSEPIKINWPEYGLDNKIFRVAKCNYGSLKDGRVTFDVIEDVFSFGALAYNVVGGSGWTAPTTTPTAATLEKVFEQPYWFHKTDENRPVSLVASPGGGQLNHDVYASTDGGVNYTLLQSEALFVPVGQLLGNYPATTDYFDAMGFELSEVSLLSSVLDVNPNDIKNGQGLLWFEDTNEIAAFEDISYNAITGRYQIARVWRAVLDTLPQSHLTGERVWFISLGGAFPNQAYADAVAIKLKHPTRSVTGVLDLGAATARDLTFNQNRSERPIPPADFQINGSANPSGVAGDLNLSWKHRDRTQQPEVLQQTSANVGPEAGVTYTLRFYNAGNTLIRTVTGLTGTSYQYTAAQEYIDNGSATNSSLRIELEAVRGSFVSLHKWNKTISRLGLGYSIAYDQDYF